MRQVILIGFSTTGKTTFIDNHKDKLVNRDKLDTDKVISKDFDESISNIYYSFPNLQDAYAYINEKEIEVLNTLSKADNNIIIAAGPGIPSKPEFSNYVNLKNPHVVLLERPAEEIYDSLLKRRNRMKTELSHKRPDFGKWDIGVMVDELLNEYPKDVAIGKIQALLNERNTDYKKHSTIVINSSDIFSGNLPQKLLDIL